LTVHRGRIATLQRRQRDHETFTRKLIESQEAERARIARELHDTLGQNLVLINNQALLGMKRGAAERGDAMSEISSMATHAIAEVKEIAYHLRPYQLDRLGLTKALEALFVRIEISTTLTVSRQIDDVDAALSKEAAITLYRIVQESVNNVLKHAQATTLDVEIVNRAGSVHARIHDDGTGFTVAAASKSPGGLGLAGMAERAAMLGAVLTVASAPGRGTTITLVLPASRGPQ
jgi:signal transduction histidine kinase